jgi:hypothetical protein
MGSDVYNSPEWLLGEMWKIFSIFYSLSDEMLYLE